jgi:hypothetical protein
VTKTPLPSTSNATVAKKEDSMNNQIVIYRDDDGYEVWSGVHGDNIKNAHIIGHGVTREAAVSEAVQYLESALEVLQAPPGVARETDVEPFIQ